MRMNGLAYVDRISTHFYGQCNFAYQVASVGTHNTAAQYSMCFSIEQQLGKALVAPIGDGPPRCRPWEQAFLDRNAVFLGIVFGQDDPGNFEIGKGKRRNHTRLEEALFAGNAFSSNGAINANIGG